jgi:hypothetical protein
MPSLGFSIENKPSRDHRTPSAIRAYRNEQESGDGLFIAGMFGLGLVFLVIALYHDHARLLLHRFVGL